MLSTVPRYQDKFSRNNRFLNFSSPFEAFSWRRAESPKQKSKPRTKSISFARSSESEGQPQEGVKEDIRQVSSSDAQNENLARDSGAGVNSPATPTATPLTHEALTLDNSLEMHSHFTRDITGSPRSRQSDNPLADLSKVNEYLIHRKRIAIARLMGLLDEWFDSSPAFARHAQEGSTSSSRCAASDEGDTCPTGSRYRQSSSRPKRGLPGDGIDGSDPSDDGDGEKERGNKRSRVDPPNTSALACPFFKNDPSKHKHKRACTGPGYVSISRLKEHIYRCHYQRYKCIRCYEAFKDAEKLEEHQRADDPCRKSNATNSDGITEAQHQLLKKKPSTGKAHTEQWAEIYRIIFPKANEIPSPYYEYGEGRSPQDLGEQAYREILRDEVTQRVRETLEAQFDQMEDSIKADFVNIVRDAFGDAIKQLPDPRSAHQGSAKAHQADSSASGASQATAVAGTGTSFPEDLLSYYGLGDFQPLPTTDIGDASLFTYTEQLLPNYELEPYFFSTDNPVDSAYGSLDCSTGSPASCKG
ncbi:hypothetical protein DL766_001389 [Monosporascus sp. MC13-8B]|uniref:C2H2-type domain-containing protein n=1 Tax=Monosporascus cannonballus TaxID=155416 RepID=A0ABY0HH29_9PEZI|nr:hypothetical protein DL762_001218 [Monosporascus cannonballus]RYO98883.1 hypothetical protein DL763_001926 [Monosporascus cannonballus]RYP37740.1 hypothetical protein DL766_001389 [Monosporascus sp. MC13-8B]